MRSYRREFLDSTGGVVAAVITGCISNTTDPEPEVLDQTVRLTTTTSMYDTGLLDEINTAFAARFGARIEVIAQGTGAALQTSRNGDADVVMVHARSIEDEFIHEGYGINRRTIILNEFLVVGPSDDPAERSRPPAGRLGTGE